MAADTSGNLYLVGTSEGHVFLAKYDDLGNRKWHYRGESGGQDEGIAVAVGPDNSVYIGGHTTGLIETGGQKLGSFDIFLAKFHPTDNVPVWIRQFGSSGFDLAEAVTVDNTGSVYVTGVSKGEFDNNVWLGNEDLIIAKYTGSGTRIWSRQYGTDENEYGSGVTVDGNGNVYLVGYTDADFDGAGAPANGIDIFLAKVDPANGDRVWTVQERSPGVDRVEGLAYDAHAGGALLVGGSTRGNLGGPNAGDFDCYLILYDLSGARKWSRQLGTTSSEEIWGVAAAGDGSSYAAGSTSGLLRPGETSAGSRDAILIKVDSSGTVR